MSTTYSLSDRIKSIIAIALTILQFFILGVILLPIYYTNMHLSIRIFRAVGSAMYCWIFQLIGLKLTIFGKSPIKQCLIISNHMHYFDVPIITCIANRFGLISFVAKSTLNNVPYFNDLIFVKRDGGDMDLLRRVREQLKIGQSIGIFPEGARVSPNNQIPFSKSIGIIARYFKLPVVAISHNIGYAMNKKRWFGLGLTKFSRPVTVMIHPETDYDGVIFKYCFNKTESSSVSMDDFDVIEVVRLADKALGEVKYDLNRAIRACQMMKDLSNQAKDTIFTNEIEDLIKSNITSPF